MANENHVGVVRRGIEAVRLFQAARPNFLFDLAGAELRRVNLVEANENKKASLDGADLSGANLEEADLRWADLRGANLTGANLRSTNLHAANLSGAQLVGASLWYTNLEDVDLTNANLTEATFVGATKLRNTKLEGAQGLETIKHERRSVIDDDTLVNTSGLPRAFLEGCGLDQEAIEEYLKQES